MELKWNGCLNRVAGFDFLLAMLPVYTLLCSFAVTSLYENMNAYSFHAATEDDYRSMRCRGLSIGLGRTRPSDRGR